MNDTTDPCIWLSENRPWLDRWLDNVEYGEPGSLLMQNFFEPIRSDKSHAKYLISTKLLIQAVFGIEQHMAYSAGIIYSFSGFVARYNRLPTDNDRATFIASKWFTVEFRPTPAMFIAGELLEPREGFFCHCNIRFDPHV